jgi:hypothetical protein
MGRCACRALASTRATDQNVACPIMTDRLDYSTSSILIAANALAKKGIARAGNETARAPRRTRRNEGQLTASFCQSCLRPIQ